LRRFVDETTRRMRKSPLGEQHLRTQPLAQPHIRR
jgi:hypothetical protein